MRVVSLLPAATDVVLSLGLGDALVGVTHECRAPAGTPVVTRSGLAQGLSSREISKAVRGSRGHAGSSLYALSADVLAALRPDVVLTQDLCDVCAVSYEAVGDAVRVLDADVRVVSLEPTTVAGVLDQLPVVGDLLGAGDRGRAEQALARGRLDRLAERTQDLPRPRVAVLEWLDPLWPAGHWVPEQVALGGGREVFGASGVHTAAADADALRAADPDVLLLAPCGLPVRQTLAEWPGVAAGLADLRAVAAGQVWALDSASLMSCPSPSAVVRGRRGWWRPSCTGSMPTSWLRGEAVHCQERAGPRGVSRGEAPGAGPHAHDRWPATSRHPLARGQPPGRGSAAAAPSPRRTGLPGPRPAPSP